MSPTVGAAAGLAPAKSAWAVILRRDARRGNQDADLVVVNRHCSR